MSQSGAAATQQAELRWYRQPSAQLFGPFENTGRSKTGVLRGQMSHRLRRKELYKSAALCPTAGNIIFHSHILDTLKYADAQADVEPLTVALLERQILHLNSI